jgi:DNA anti-recombination protein RmuC
MDGFFWILMALLALALLGLLWEFRLITFRGLAGGLLALVAAAGIVIFVERRKNRALQAFRKREQELKQLEKELRNLSERYNLSRDEIRRTEAALNRERQEMARKLLLLEAEKNRRLREAKEKIRSMPPEELLEAYSRLLGETRL